MGLDEMTGSPNLIIVPDPATFRVLPWEPNVGWILCDEYFIIGQAFLFFAASSAAQPNRAAEKTGMRVSSVWKSNGIYFTSPKTT